MDNFCAVDVFCLFQANKVQCAVSFLNLCALFLSEELGKTQGLVQSVLKQNELFHIIYIYIYIYQFTKYTVHTLQFLVAKLNFKLNAPLSLYN